VCGLGGRSLWEGDVQLHKLQLLLFGQYVLNIWFELWVFFEDFGADGALGAGFDFGFCAGEDAGLVLATRFLFLMVVCVLLFEHHGGGCMGGSRGA
jgi:hypothetical protein